VHDQDHGSRAVSARFEEIDRSPTPLGELTLRRRREPTLDVDVYEVKLGDEFLMSSLFTVAEVELATRALAETTGDALDVVVGGLGLGYTARAILDDPRVRSLHVVDALGEVIRWHERHLLPLSEELTTDPRCHLAQGDFFALCAGDAGFGVDGPSRYHAVVVDIDHTPRHVLHPSHAGFYTREGLERLVGWIQPGGVFGLWSDDRPDDDFIAVAEEVFVSCDAHVIGFPNFYTGGESANTVYLARVGDVT
jgi:spermidine synthase